MKKLLSLKPAAIYLVAGLSLVMILGSFWHYQTNQTRLNQISLAGQGLTTCFGRLSQSFTAMMISDVTSPYMKADFMGMTDECLAETKKSSEGLRTTIGKAFENLTQLNAEAQWFHEKLGRLKTAADLTTAIPSVSDRYGRMEEYKQTLMDELEASGVLIRKVQNNTEVLLGLGLIFFVISLSLLSLQEYQRIEARKMIEREALSYLTTGQANMGAIVDQLVEKALRNQEMPVTAQIFRDYHETILEKRAARISTDEAPVVEAMEEEAMEVAPEATGVEAEKASLKEALVTLQNLHTKDQLQITELRDVQVLANSEGIEHMLNAAVNALMGKRTDDRKIMVGSQIHSDRVVLNFFCGGNVFSATELEYSSNPAIIAEDLDMNLQILKEMVQVVGCKWFIENKVDRHGKITGMNIRLVLDRAMKENRPKNLVSVMKGKKRDLAKAMNH